jgi:hypothetical protein
MEAFDIYKRFLKGLFLTTGLCFCVSFSFAQPVLPQRSLTVTATQTLFFGTVCLTGSGGGTVIMGYDGSRVSSGNIALLAMSPTSHPAIFEIKLCKGRNVIITFDPTTILTGSNGGSLTIDIGPTEKGINGAIFSTISDCNFVTLLRVGGTLHIPGNALPGIYTGNFAITFNQQ